ncbi:MAG: hypothetical protein KDC28_09500 [Saprospiraceae bacterium]|nr:hypothetical protein [Saprospiraceae bacterium]MCB9318996.1 hypothetical protein [Lewinellaceae bacterium]
MTSARNRRLPLNGSKGYMRIVIFCFTVLLAGSCSFTKKTTTTKPATTGSPTHTAGHVYNPKTGQWEPANPDNTRVDTLTWGDLPEPAPVEDQTFEDLRPESNRKDRYQVSLLLPLQSQDISTGSDKVPVITEKFIQYLIGYEQGVKKLEREGIYLDTKVFDTENSQKEVSQIIKDPTFEKTDLILGPYRRNMVEEMADYVKTKQVPMVTPWTSFSQFGVDNPFYVLSKPGYQSHCQFIMDDISHRYPNAQVFLVYREGEEYFKNFFGDETKYISFVVHDETMDLQNTFPDSVVTANRPNVFIIPHFRFAESERRFVYAMLRKIGIIPPEYQVTTYILPQMKSLAETDYDLFNQSRIYILETGMTRTASPDYQTLKRYFQNEFNTFVTEDALEAYDQIVFAGRMLKKHGTQFQYYLEGESYDDPVYMQFEFKPVYPSGQPRSAEETGVDQIQYFENQHFELIQLKDFQFVRVQN